MPSCGQLDDAKYDIAFADASGNDIGLMLARNNGKPQYAQWTDPSMSRQFFTGQAQYANLEPLKELQMGQASYEQGFGAEYFDGGRCYYTASNVDARFKNMVICGPLATAASIPSVPSITDAGMEVWTGATLDNWTYSETQGNFSLAQESTIVDAGTYSARIGGGVGAAGYGQILQTMVTWTNDWRNKTIAVAVRIYNTDITVQKGQLILDDGVDTTTANSTQSDVWETVVCTHKLNAAATKLDIICRNLLVGGAGLEYVYFDNVKIPTTGAHGSHWADFDSDTFFSSGGFLLRVSNSTGAISMQAGFPTDITGLTHFSDGKLYIFTKEDDAFVKDTGIDTDEALDISETGITCDADPSSAIPIGSIIKIESELMYVSNSAAVGTLLTVVRGILGTSAATHATNKDIYLRNNYYYYMDLSENVTQSDSVKDFACSIGSTMYSVLKPNMIFTATDPTTDTWSSETKVGSISDNITAILGVAGTPYVIKEDYPRYIDSDGNVQDLAPQLNSERSTTSGVNTVEWKGNLYIPCGAQALYEYDTSTSVLTDISPSKYITNSSTFDGQIQALAGDSQYLYVIIDNATSVEVVAGRWETVGGSVQFVWHPIATLTLTGAANAWSATTYKRRLWIASTSSSDSLYYYPLTAMYGNITSDTDYTYQTGGNLITPFYHSDLTADEKGFYKISLTMSGTSSTVYWRAYYQLLGGNWTEINSTSKFKTSPITTAYLPVETTTSNKPASTMIRFKFEPVTGSTASTPKLLNWDVRALWFPVQKKIITCKVRVADNIVTRDGQRDETQTAATIRTALDAWINPTVSWPRAFYPLHWESTNDTVYAKLLPTDGAPFYDTVISEEGNLEYIANLTILIQDGLSF